MQILNSETVSWPNMKILQIEDSGRPPFWNPFDHNSASDCQISVKLCDRKQFFLQNFGNRTYTRVPQNVFLFSNAVWASASGAFHIVSDTLVTAGVRNASQRTAPQCRRHAGSTCGRAKIQHGSNCLRNAERRRQADLALATLCRDVFVYQKTLAVLIIVVFQYLFCCLSTFHIDFVSQLYYTVLHYVINPLIATLKPQSNGLSYSNTVMGTLAVDGWTVTFGTARRGLGGAATRLAVPNVTAHPLTASVPTSYYSM